MLAGMNTALDGVPLAVTVMSRVLDTVTAPRLSRATAVRL